jgi:hypothetical protein
LFVFICVCFLLTRANVTAQEMPKPKRVNAWCKPPVVGKLTTERALADFRCQLSNRRKSNFLYSSSVSTAISIPCDSSSLRVGLCVPRKFIDWGANIEFPATFYPHASTNFLQFVETIFPTRDNGESALSNVFVQALRVQQNGSYCARRSVIDRPTATQIPPVVLFFMTSTSDITSRTLKSRGRIQTVCQTLVSRVSNNQRF